MDRSRAEASRALEQLVRALLAPQWRVFQQMDHQQAQVSGQGGGVQGPAPVAPRPAAAAAEVLQPSARRGLAKRAVPLESESGPASPWARAAAPGAAAERQTDHLHQRRGAQAVAAA